MESGDYKRKHHRRDDEEHRRNRDRKRHHRHKDREGKVECSPNSGKRNRNIDEHHHRKRNGDESNHHKHKSKEERKEKDNEKIYFKERKEHKQKHCKESREILPVDQKTVERYLANINVSNKTKSARSIDTICNKYSKRPPLCKYKTFHLGQTEKVPCLSEIGEEIEEISKRRKHRARSERQSNEKNKVSQIWYCQIDTTVPFKQIRKSEERPETVPKKYDRTSQRLRIKQRPKSTPEKNTNGEFYHSSSRSQLIKAKTHSSKRSKAEKGTVNKQDISRKIEDEYTKKIENNLKIYLGKIEKLIDKKLNDYLHIKNSKLRETIDDNVKFIEKERNKHQHGRDREKRLKKRKSSLIRSISSHEEISGRVLGNSLTKNQKRSKSKVFDRSHQPTTDIFPIEAKYEDARHPHVLQLNRTSKRESRHNSMARELFKEKRYDRSPSIKRETTHHEKKYDECAYNELNFEKGYLRGDIRTSEDKRKKVKKSKNKTQTEGIVINPSAVENVDTKFTDTRRFINKYKKQELIPSYEEPPLTVVPKEEHGMATRNAKIQHDYSPFTNTYPPKQLTNESNNQNPSTSVVYFKPTFSRKNIPSFSVYEKNSSSFELFTRQTNENQVEDFVSNQRYSQESGNIPHKKNNFIVEGIEPAKRLVPSSAKPSKRKHMRNLECKTVSIITIPSQDQGNKYFPLGSTKGNTVENKNKMKRLKLYYQYSMDSNKCSGTTFSEEKSVVSESVKIFSDFSDLNGKPYGESNVLRLSNKQPYECYLDPNLNNSRRKNMHSQKIECFEFLQSKLDNCPIEGGDMSTKQEKNKRVTSEVHLHIENDRQVTDKLPQEQRDEGTENKSVKLQEETAVFNVEILKSALQAHKDIDKQQNPNNQILKYLEHMYCLLVSTLPQNDLIREKMDVSSNQNISSYNKRKVVENEITENLLDVIENDEVTKRLEKKTVDTSYHELLTDEQVPKVDQVTSYHLNCENSASKLSENKPAVKTIDQVTSYHKQYEGINKNLNKKHLVDQASHLFDVVDKAAGKDFKSMEIMAVLDAVNYAISKSVTTMSKDLENLGKKKQLELEATKEEIIKIFDTATHNIDVQTVCCDGKYVEDNVDNYLSPKLIRSTQKFSNVTYETICTDTNDTKNKSFKKSEKPSKLKNESAHNKNKLALEVVKDKLLSACKEKPTKQEHNIETVEVKTRQKNPIKSKFVERTSSNSKIPKRIKQSANQSNIKNEFLQYPFKKSQSEISLRQLYNEKGKGRISSLICLHRYMNDVNFPDSSVSCMDNFYLGRSVNNEQTPSSRLFLTKDYRSTQMSSYQRRKIYDEVIRNKMKKKTLTQDKKIGQVFEVRYITLDKGLKKPETLKKISESKIEESEHKSFHDFAEESTDLVKKKSSLNLIQKNMTSDKKSTLAELLSSILTSTEFSKVKPKLKKECTCNNFINIIKELSSCLKEPESSLKMNRLTISDDSTLLPNSKTYTLSKNSVTAERRSGFTIKNSGSSSDFLYNDDHDEDESQPKATANPILGFAFKSDANIKKTETGSFVESQNSEESGYISSGRSKYNLSLSSFFKNPVISELLKPQGEYVCTEETRSLHEIESKLSQEVPSKSSQEEMSEEGLVEIKSSEDIIKDSATTNSQCETLENDQEVSISTSLNSQKYSDISEESPLQFVLPKSSIGMLGIRKSISEIDIQPKSSDDDLQESFSGSCPRRVQSETFLENKTHILNTVQYVNECGDTVYSRSMQLYTEIIENNCKEDISILKRLLDAGVYLIATNFNTGCITLVIDTSTNESFYKRDTYDHYDVNTCTDAADVKKLVARKFFENLLRVYERECIVGALLFDDKEFMENELFSSVRGIKNYASRNRFGKRMRTFLRKMFFNSSKIINRGVAAGYTEKGLPLDEYYQRHFQMLADYGIQHFSTLVETMPFSLDKNVEMNICGFFTLLKRIKNGQFIFLRVEEDIDIEENIRNQTKQAFRNIYSTAYNEARKYRRKLTNHDMNLVGVFVCKYRIGLLTRIDLITSYLGRGFFETEVELKAAVVYVMKVLTSIIELEDFENHCKNTDVHVQK